MNDRPRNNRPQAANQVSPVTLARSPRPRFESLEERFVLAAVTWTIDEVASHLTFNLPNQAFHLGDNPSGLTDLPITARNQLNNINGVATSGTWSTLNDAKLTGSIESNYEDGVSIQILSTPGSIAAIAANVVFPKMDFFVPIEGSGTNGDFVDPNVYPGTAETYDYGGGIYSTALGTPIGPFSISNTTFEFASDSETPVPIVDGSFSAGATLGGIYSGLTGLRLHPNIVGAFNLGYNGLRVNVHVDPVTNTALTDGTITDLGDNVRQLTLPVTLYHVHIPAGTGDLIFDVTGTIVATATLAVSADEVANRQIFYNQSAFDNNDPAIDFVSDANAIATDKTAYLPGAGTAVFANITSFTRGINGIIIDLNNNGGGTHANISASDFVFKMSAVAGTDAANPESWVAAPAPAAVQVSIGGGITGSDRVEITWATGSIVNRWLEVGIKDNAQTGLAASGNNINGTSVGDIFFWGNRVGDGNGDFFTANGDAGLALGNPARRLLRIPTTTTGRARHQRRRRTGAGQSWLAGQDQRQRLQDRSLRPAAGWRRRRRHCLGPGQCERRRWRRRGLAQTTSTRGFVRSERSDGCGDRLLFQPGLPSRDRWVTQTFTTRVLRRSRLTPCSTRWLRRWKAASASRMLSRGSWRRDPGSCGSSRDKVVLRHQHHHDQRDGNANQPRRAAGHRPQVPQSGQLHGPSQ